MTIGPNEQGFPGQQMLSSDASEFNLQTFLIDRVLSRISTATLVKVVSVSTAGQVGPVGKVAVTPLVKMVDGNGKVFEHGKLHNLPYFRLQGGNGKAIIMDPKAGDIGIAIFADRDISSVKKNKKTSPPGSYRRFDMADGLYIGGFLGETPTCYIRFTDDNKIIASVGTDKPFQFVVADTHVQMKQFGEIDMHITIDKNTGLITSGKAIIVAPDPYPGD